MSIFRNFFGGNDRGRFLYEEDDPQDYAVDTAAPQYIRYRGRAGYPTMVNQQSLAPHMGSTLDPLVDYRDPPRVLEPRVVETPVVRMKPPPRVVQEVRANQAHPVPLVPVVQQMNPALNHVHRVIEFRVPLCCEGCQDRIMKHFRHVRGVENVSCDLNRHKVTIHGYAPPHEVLRILRKQFPRAEFWTPEPVVVVQKNQGPTPRKVTVVEPPGTRHTPVNVVDETGARHPEVAVEHVHGGPPPRQGVRVH
ncbi:unnamed protein product [Calypogeia fissa]